MQSPEQLRAMIEQFLDKHGCQHWDIHEKNAIGFNGIVGNESNQHYSVYGEIEIGGSGIVFYSVSRTDMESFMNEKLKYEIKPCSNYEFITALRQILAPERH